MDAEGKFWCGIFSIISITVISLIGSIAGCTVYENKQMAAMVKDGADPLDVACMVKPGSIDHSICALRTQKVKP